MQSKQQSFYFARVSNGSQGVPVPDGNGYVLLMPLSAFWYVLETSGKISLGQDFAEGSNVCEANSIFPSHFVKSL